MTRNLLSPVSRWALLLSFVASACAHQGATAHVVSETSHLTQAREAVRQQARLAKMEAQLVALEARVQTLQAQARALHERTGERHMGLPSERWQPVTPLAIERWSEPEARAIEGQGDKIRLSVKSRRRESP